MHVRGALDLLRVTPEAVAPLVEDSRLTCVFVWVSERVPHLRVLGHQPKGHLLAPAADEDRHRTRGPGLQFLDALLDSRQRLFESAKPVFGLPESEPVLLVVALVPAGAEAEHEPPA